MMTSPWLGELCEEILSELLQKTCLNGRQLVFSSDSAIVGMWVHCDPSETWVRNES